MQSESTYLDRAKKAFVRIERAFDEVDPDVIDCERSSGDVISLLFLNGVKCVINTQRPTQQIWVAASAQAWHFAWDEAAATWLDPKRDNAELFDTLSRIVKDNTDLTPAF